MTTLPLSRRDVARSVDRQVAASKKLIAQRLRALQGPLTHRKVAERIGVDVRNWGRWTSPNDPTIPSYESLEKVAAAFEGVAPEDILQTDDELETLRGTLDRIEAKIDAIIETLALRQAKEAQEA